MVTIAEIRAKYPDYGDMSDAALADAMHGKYYSDVPKAEFIAKIGLNQNSPPTDNTVTLTDTPPAPVQRPDDIVKRGTILPYGVTRDDKTVAALPGIVAGPVQTIRDLLEGKRTPDQISGREMFELGLLVSPGAPRVGLPAGKEVAAVAASRAADDAARPAAAAEGVAVEAAPVARSAPEPAPQTSVEFKTSATSFYKTMEESGVNLKPESFSSAVDDIVKSAVKDRLDKTLTPDSVAAVKRLQAEAKAASKEGRPVTFETLDTLRQIASDAQGSVRPNDRRVAGNIVDKIDDYIAGLGAKDTTSGDAQVAAQAVVKARELWSKGSQLDTVARLVERAKETAGGFSASGFENALRTEFRALAKNDKKMRTFPAEVQTAIKRVSRGTVGSKAARNVGRFSPTGPVSAGLGLGSLASAATALGLGAEGVGLTVAGGAGVAFAARQLATAMIKRHIRQLEDVIRGGGGSASAESSLTRARSVLERLSLPTAEQNVEEARRK